ncbi:hypothetical protein [uncultured Aquimarina sp.]|uniref:hypothetical protein n=1 Tax=uncultured Aquimarina sp. TaxID=575652 RepID=UPI002633EAF2|nr:hypothetical protein [uncultured Aquimarina sp.]
MGRYYLILFSFLLFSISIHSQTVQDLQSFRDSLKQKYDETAFRHQVRSLYKDTILKRFYIDTLATSQDLFTTYGDSLDIKLTKDKLLHYKSLNILFNREINKLLTEVSDLSTRSAFATLEEQNNRLALGYVLTPNGATSGGTDYISTIWSMGLEADIEDNFSNLATNGEIQNNIGVFVKFTKLFRGSIMFDKNRDIHSFRNRYLLNHALKAKYKDYEEQRDDKIELDVQKELSLDTSLPKKVNLNDSIYIAAYKKAYAATMKKEYDQMVNKSFNETLTDELETSRNKELINAFSKVWLSGRIYMPISITEYEVFREESSPNSETKRYYPLSLEGSFNYYRKSRRYGTLQLTGRYNAFMNNSIAANILKERTFTTIPDNSNSNPVELTTSTKFIGDYDSFVTQNIKADFVYFPFDWPAGISVSFDYSIGEFEASTWKFGIPFYFKGKNDSSAVSVELQWREVHEKTLSGEVTQSLGFSIGIPFGNYINE